MPRIVLISEEEKTLIQKKCRSFPHTTNLCRNFVMPHEDYDTVCLPVWGRQPDGLMFITEKSGVVPFLS